MKEHQQWVQSRGDLQEKKKERVSELLPVPPSKGISPRRRADILRKRYLKFEELCLSAEGDGLPMDMSASKYLLEILSLQAKGDDPDLAAVVLDWLATPIHPPWHFYISDCKQHQLFFISDGLLVAHPLHPDLSAIRYLIKFADRAQTRPDALKLVVEAEAELEVVASAASDWQTWGDAEQPRSGVVKVTEAVKLEIQTQKRKLINYIKQYVSRKGIPQHA